MVSSKFDVVVVGSVVQDLTSYAERFPAPGESIRGTEFLLGFGGKGANQAVQASLLGAKSAIVAKVGADSFGKNAVENFTRMGVNCGQNSIVVCLGANLCLSVDDVRKAESYIENSKVLLCQLEVKPEVSLEALKIAKKHGIMTIFNPAPALPGLSEELWKYSDIVCPNENEAEIITGVNSTTDENAKASLGYFLDRGCEVAVITLGERGCVFATTSDREVHCVPAPAVKCIDSTGAGDAFAGSLAFYAACHGHLPIEEILRRAIQIASFAVQYQGTQSSYLPKAKIPRELFE
ncbi:unnamed protein product [Soboliphyme baturini]|uniref:Ribokinase n=1 Tax=Soboliphyme baturini TaxID=241478 RepID=A0A183IU04_9BILA|nr:unnamed protein product [Soboliphyme baturini]